MKLNIILASVGASVGFFAVAARSQTPTPPTPPPPAASASGTVQIQNNGAAVNQGQATIQQVPPAQRQLQVSPALQNRQQSQSTVQGANGGANGQFTATNRFAATNSGFRTNTPGWSPTGRVNETNRMFGTNSSHGSNQTNVASQDRALTAADQTLLVQIRQTVSSRLQPSGAWSPAVHFQVNNGIVTLMGVVTTIQISQQVEMTTTQVPGVVRVVNRLAVSNESGVSTGAAVPAAQTNSTESVPR